MMRQYRTVLEHWITGVLSFANTASPTPPSATSPTPIHNNGQPPSAVRRPIEPVSIAPLADGHAIVIFAGVGLHLLCLRSR